MTDQATKPTSDERLEKLIILLGQRLNTHNEILQDIALSLREIARTSNPAPNYKHALHEFQDFDWASIGAEIVTQDQDGAAVVAWNGQQFTRRSGGGKFGAAVWFSRAVGKDGDDVKYVRLITFKDSSEAEPVAVKTAREGRAA